ncbi:hypothetical protein GCM10007170_44640 [Arthrobacter liuii]|uniref:Uncharacterized protein n=1 Tax=Arthrobacter liuii TaxID=1476996 RepID=A0ABQ2AYQ5_9MICC|nr:hypothetical protein GCM10007170_44640 [Arthrobacter liuii]
MAHDGRIRQQEEGFGHQRAKGREGEAEYFPGRAAGAGRSGRSWLLWHAASLTAPGGRNGPGMTKTTIVQI